ncbi:MAG: SDR family NAD(P)-dependent oxidoreductase [Alphaproteobacteria bacterium]
MAVVTGGASGIGLAIARHLAGEGWAVVVADRNDAACAKASEVLDGKIVVADVGTPEGAKATIEAAIEAFGRIDLLCNNAAVHPLETIEDHALESWRNTFRVNVDGTMLCSQAAIPHMKRVGGGAIVNIGSISGVAPYAGGGAYAASKAAVAMLTRVLALEAGPFGITTNCIAPGAIRHGERPDGEAPPTNIPVGRAGTTDDVAHLVSFLASGKAGYVNGSVIVLDGGATGGRVRVGGRKH